MILTKIIIIIFPQIVEPSVKKIFFNFYFSTATNFLSGTKNTLCLNYVGVATGAMRA